MTGVQRTIECLAREVAQVEADKQRFEARCETLEAMVAELEGERDELREGLAVLQAGNTKAEQILATAERLSIENVGLTARVDGLYRRVNELEATRHGNPLGVLHRVEAR